MIDETTIENMFALHRLAPFHVLTESELLLIAKHARRRAFRENAVIIKQGDVSDILFVGLNGAISGGERQITGAFDAHSVFFGIPAQSDYTAGPNGAEVLCFAKSHIFTLARECPEFVLGIAEGMEHP